MELNCPGHDRLLLKLRRAYPLGFIMQLLVRHSQHLDVHIDPVEQRTGFHSFLIF